MPPIFPSLLGQAFLGLCLRELCCPRPQPHALRPKQGPHPAEHLQPPANLTAKTRVCPCVGFSVFL